MTSNSISELLVLVPVDVTKQDGGRYDGTYGTPVDIQASQAALEFWTGLGLGMDVCQSSADWILISGSKTYPRKELVVDEKWHFKVVGVSSELD